MKRIVHIKMEIDPVEYDGKNTANEAINIAHLCIIGLLDLPDNITIYCQSSKKEFVCGKLKRKKHVRKNNKVVIKTTSRGQDEYLSGIMAAIKS